MSNSRTPTALLDDLRIYCYQQKEKGESVSAISKKVLKDRSNILYHIRKYADLFQVDKLFRIRVKEFNETEFLKTYNNYKRRSLIKKK